MYYGLIILSVIMFGMGFVANDSYQKREGDNIIAALWFSLISSVAGALILFCTNGFVFECTPFTLVMGIINAVSSILLTYCGFKALGRINLSLHSLFMMLGGMALPFLQGILFYGEGISVQKCVCFLFICLSLTVTVKRSESKGGAIYYVLIFILNGLAGVLSKIFTESGFEKTSAAGYSLIIALCSAVLSGAMLLFFRGGHRLSAGGITVAVAGGVVNRVANFILVIALMHVDASVQYPLVTGGVMITHYIFVQKLNHKSKYCLQFL